MKHDLSIGYLTIEDPRDRRSWSGTHHFLLRALERRVRSVVVMGPLPTPFAVLACKIFNQLTLRLLGKRFNYRASRWVARAYARIVQERLAANPVDLLIAPAGLATTAYLRTDIPIVYINDRCIAGALDYHDILQDLFDWSRDQSLATERAALRNASLSVFSSSWAADAAKVAAPEVAERIRMIPFGANLSEPPAEPGTGTWPGGKLKLLFIGVYWHEKGGPMAYETLLALKRAGIAVQLVVCGCDPPADCDDPDLVREGFLNKNDPSQLERLQAHLRTADFMVLPTRFEAYGIVFCEAAAYGIPVLATRTGGIPTIVEEGRTGFLFDLTEGGEFYAERIRVLLADPSAYSAMRKAARDRFNVVLNWETFVQELLDRAVPLITPKSVR